MRQQKFERRELMFKNDVPNNILKPPLPPPGAFFYGGGNPLERIQRFVFYKYLAQDAFLQEKSFKSNNCGIKK